MIVSTDAIEGPFRVRLYLSGEIEQDGSTRDLIFSIPEINNEVTAFIALEPGDVIATGTPAGVGPLSPGDIVGVKIDGIGTWQNRARAAPR